MARLAPPLPPNRTGGSPASGFPVSGFLCGLTMPGAMFQTETAPVRKPSVRPASDVGFPSPCPVASRRLRRMLRSRRRTQPSDRCSARRWLCWKYPYQPRRVRFILGDDRPQAPSASCARSAARTFSRSFFRLFFRGHLWPRSKVTAQEVKAFALRVHDPRLGRVQRQSGFRRPGSQIGQRLLGFFLGSGTGSRSRPRSAPSPIPACAIWWSSGLR